MDNKILKDFLQQVEEDLKRSEKGERITLSTIVTRMEKFLVENEKLLSKSQLSQIQEKYRTVVDRISMSLEQASYQAILAIKDIENIHTGDRSPESHKECANFCNNLIYTIVNEILSTKSLVQRTLILERWIALMKDRFNHQDYQTVSIIMSALNNEAVSKLRKTFNGLSAKAKHIKEQVETLMLKHRSLLFEKRSGAIIPTLDYYKLHLTRTVEFNNQEATNRYKDEFLSIQKELKEHRNIIKNKCHSHFMDYKPLKLLNLESNDYAKMISRLAETLEPRDAKLNTKQEKSPVILAHLEQDKSFLIQDQSLTLTPKVKAVLESQKINKHIEQVHFKLWELMNKSNLKNSTKPKNDLMNVHLTTVHDHVANKAGTGSIPNRNDIICAIESELSGMNEKKLKAHEKEFKNNLKQVLLLLQDEKSLEEKKNMLAKEANQKPSFVKSSSTRVLSELKKSCPAFQREGSLKELTQYVDNRMPNIVKKALSLPSKLMEEFFDIQSIPRSADDKSEGREIELEGMRSRKMS